MILPNQPMQQPVAQPMAQPMQQPMQQPVVQQPVMQQPMAQQPVQPNTNAAGIGSAAMVANQVTPTSPNKESPLSTQSTLLISELRDNVVIMKDGSFRAVVACKSINFDLMSEVEREGVEYSYQNFLNSLKFTTQILIRSQRVDIGPYIERLSEIRRNNDNMLLGVLMDDYINFIDILSQEANIMDKAFFIVADASDPGAREVQIRDVERYQLADANPRGVQELKHCLVAVALRVGTFRLLEKELHFLAGEDLRKLLRGLVGNQLARRIGIDKMPGKKKRVKTLERSDVARNRGDRLSRGAKSGYIFSEFLLTGVRVSGQIMRIKIISELPDVPQI